MFSNIDYKARTFINVGASCRHGSRCLDTNGEPRGQDSYNPKLTLEEQGQPADRETNSSAK